MPLLSFSLVTWYFNGLLLAAGAQWVSTAARHVPLRSAVVVTLATALHGPLNELVLRVPAGPFLRESPLPVAPGFFLLWSGGLGGACSSRIAC